jgi:uncharacterized protein
VNKNNYPLRLNVGFIVHQSAGFSRDFQYYTSHIHLPPDLDVQDLSGDVRVTRTTEGVLLQAEFQGDIPIQCSRCLDDFDITVKTEFTELYAFPTHADEDTEFVLPDNYQINLSDSVREYLLLSIPINPICREDCQGLCPICGENFNLNTCDCEVDTTDPRFDVLKELLDESE